MSRKLATDQNELMALDDFCSHPMFAACHPVSERSELLARDRVEVNPITRYYFTAPVGRVFYELWLKESILHNWFCRRSEFTWVGWFSQPVHHES